jgi:hypothetical protein
MFLKKMVYVSLLAIGVSGVAVAGGSLTLHNATNEFSTSIVNSGACSTWLGAIGTTAPGATNTIDAGTIKKACTFWPHNCQAAIYMQQNCGGPVVAVATFDTDKGVVAVTNNNIGYTLTVDPANKFSIEVSYTPK